MELIINVVANENGTISVSGADEQLNNANEKQRKVLEAIKKACSECINPTVEKTEESEKDMVRNIKVAYNTGYEDGYKDGYDNGYDDGSEDSNANDDYDDEVEDEVEDETEDETEDEVEDSEEYELTDEEMKFLEKDFPLEEVLRFQFGLMSEEEAITFFEKFEKALKKLGKI